MRGVSTANGHACTTATGTATWTDDFKDIQCYDTLKVKAILNEIDGKSHDGLHKTHVPNIFNMNFQAVSVGQKLIEHGVKGGYTDAAVSPPGFADVSLFWISSTWLVNLAANSARSLNSTRNASSCGFIVLRN